MSDTITKTIEFTVIDCFHCKADFAMTKKANQRYIENKEGFWCPYCGGSQAYVGKTKEQKLQEELATAKARILDAQDSARRARQDAEHFEASRNAYKGQVTKLKNRARAGMCPCCNRSFQNLRAHMATKHPNFTTEGAE